MYKHESSRLTCSRDFPDLAWRCKIAYYLYINYKPILLERHALLVVHAAIYLPHYGLSQPINYMLFL